MVECPEFRQLLLLLREQLQDKDIPHRTKIRESIIKSWEAYFKVLKAELAVQYYTYIRNNVELTTILERSRSSLIHCRYLVEPISLSVPSGHWSLDLEANW